MLVEKEVIGPGTHWYRDEVTGLPRKLEVTPELTKHWHDQGNKMLSLKLPIPVPCEHDFSSHPMTPAERLKNNAGWVKEFRLKGDKLFSVLDITDADIAKKLPTTIRWTSPWFSSFGDGAGRSWNNVVTHLCLTTRPRVTDQAPFPSIAAAMAFALTTPATVCGPATDVGKGYTLSKAGRLKVKNGKLRPEYPMAFSLYSGGIKLASDDFSDLLDDDDEDDADDITGKPPKEPKKPKEPKEPLIPEGMDIGGADPLADQSGDIPITEVLSELVGVLGIQMPAARFVTSETFLRELFTAMMAKVKEMALGAQKPSDQTNQPPMGQNNQTPPNPLIQQEQQPMYMSLEDINKIPDTTMKSIALSMYNENVKLRGELEKTSKDTASLRDAKLKEEGTKRAGRIALLGKVSPRVRADLDAMLAMPSMALSMGEGGAVIDPMAQTLAVLEKGLADMPRLLTQDSQAFTAQPHPTDDELKTEEADAIADSLARQMGCPPEQKKAG